jgi:hypothetical protein
MPVCNSYPAKPSPPQPSPGQPACTRPPMAFGLRLVPHVFLSFFQAALLSQLLQRPQDVGVVLGTKPARQPDDAVLKRSHPGSAGPD